MPATAAALGAVLDALRSRIPDFEPGTVLDLGAGPGTSAWLLRDRYPGVSLVTLVERDREFVALGRRMLADERVRWDVADLGRRTVLAPHDLVVMSYVLGELEPGVADAAVDAAWRAARHVLILVEPGTPAGNRRVLSARARVLRAGGRMAAPCPHDDECPMRVPEWCHFAVRLPRSRAQRLAKGGTVGWEDETFSYAVLARTPGAAAVARLVGHPRRATGRVTLRVCGRDGVERRVVTRRDADAYRTARRAAWGDEWS
jgi:ribosomal protein RSM22 (predicted rRNA methylase)